MKKTETLKLRDNAEIQHYRNEKLRKLIKENFSEEEAEVAWATIHLIKVTYPDETVKDALFGKLIHTEEVK